LEEHREAVSLGHRAAVLGAEVVVPAVAVERIHEQRRAQELPHFRFRHALLQLRRRFLGDDVALLHVELVDAARGGKRQQDGKKWSGEAHGKRGRSKASIIIHAMSDPRELKGTGLKVTVPRLKVLDLFQHSPERHLTAEDVYRKLLEE